MRNLAKKGWGSTKDYMDQTVYYMTQEKTLFSVEFV
jgi:hypothetical protein